MSAVTINRQHAPITHVSLELGQHKMTVFSDGSLVPGKLLTGFEAMVGELYRGHHASLPVAEIREFALALLELVDQTIRDDEF